MKKAFLIHGLYGNPNENWFPWIKKEIKKTGYKVIAPKFPTPENQSLNTWMQVMEEYVDDFDRNTILIGHSLGAAFILSLLEKIDKKIDKVYLVSGFDQYLISADNPIDKLNKTFVEKEFDWNKIKSNCKKIFMFNGDNDPYINLEIAEKLANKINAQLIVIKGGGHLNEDAGYTQFPELMEYIPGFTRNG